MAFNFYASNGLRAVLSIRLKFTRGGNVQFKYTRAIQLYNIRTQRLKSRPRTCHGS